MRTSILTAIFLAASSAASAATVSATSGTLLEYNGPYGVVLADQTSDEVTYINERQAAVLGSALNMNIGGAQAGDVVDSTLIFLNAASGVLSRSVTLAFSQEVLGVAFRNGYLSTSSARLGLSNLDYTGISGLETGANDAITVSGNMLTVDLSFWSVSGEGGDFLRVVTASDQDAQALEVGEVPLPASGILGLFGIAAFAAYGRRKA